MHGVGCLEVLVKIFKTTTMNREIKFKFWLGHTGKMTYEHSLIEISHLLWDFTEDIIALQYTGFKDKNGIDVYEGDIRQFDNGIGEIVWEDLAFAIKSPGSEAVDWEHSSVFINSKYLGNIYEHPHLLK